MVLSFRLRADVSMNSWIECPDGIDLENAELYIQNHLESAEIDWNSEIVDFESMELIGGSAAIEN